MSPPFASMPRPPKPSSHPLPVVVLPDARVAHACPSSTRTSLWARSRGLHAAVARVAPRCSATPTLVGRQLRPDRVMQLRRLRRPAPACWPSRSLTTASRLASAQRCYCSNAAPHGAQRPATRASPRPRVALPPAAACCAAAYNSCSCPTTSLPHLLCSVARTASTAAARRRAVLHVTVAACYRCSTCGYCYASPACFRRYLLYLLVL